MLCEFFYPDSMGSTGTIVSNLSRLLQDQYPDLQIDAFTSKNLYRGEARPLANYENWQGINIYRVNTPPTKRDSSLLRLLAGLWFTLAIFFKLLWRPKYDVLLVLTNPPMLPLAATGIKLLKGSRFVFLIHDLYADMSVALGMAAADSKAVKLSQKMQAGFLAKATTVVALGRCMKEYLDQKFGLDADKVCVIPNWGTIESVRTHEESAFRTENSLNGFVVLYAGNFGRFHNFDNILDAARKLEGTHPHVTFALVGGGAKKEEVAKRVQDEKIGNVRLLPFVPQEQLPDMLAAANVALITLEKGAEGLAVPCKLYNILASGRPAIAIMAAHAETARTIVEANCGLRVDQEDAEQLAQAIASLATQPELLREMGSNARKVHEQRYSLEKVAALFHAALTGAVTKKT